MTDDGDQAVSRYRRENLYTYRSFGRTPERFYSQVLFDPLEEQFDTPAVFLEQGKKDLAGLIEKPADKPEQGTALGNSFYKIRLAIASISKGSPVARGWLPT